MQMRPLMFALALIASAGCADEEAGEQNPPGGNWVDDGDRADVGSDPEPEDMGDAVDDEDTPVAEEDAAAQEDTADDVVQDASPPDMAPEQVTWSNFAEGFFATYCVSCHSPQGRASADFGQYEVVTRRLNAIRCGVAPELLDNCQGEHPPGWFPIGPGPQPSDEERWKLVEWTENDGPF